MSTGTRRGPPGVLTLIAGRDARYARWETRQVLGSYGEGDERRTEQQFPTTEDGWGY